jgi:hypothetical protein
LTSFLADPGELERYQPSGTRNKLLEHPLKADPSATFL